MSSARSGHGTSLRRRLWPGVRTLGICRRGAHCPEAVLEPRQRGRTSSETGNVTRQTQPALGERDLRVHLAARDRNRGAVVRLETDVGGRSIKRGAFDRAGTVVEQHSIPNLATIGDVDDDGLDDETALGTFVRNVGLAAHVGQRRDPLIGQKFDHGHQVRYCGDTGCFEPAT